MTNWAKIVKETIENHWEYTKFPENRPCMKLGYFNRLIFVGEKTFRITNEKRARQVIKWVCKKYDYSYYTFLRFPYLRTFLEVDVVSCRATKKSCR